MYFYCHYSCIILFEIKRNYYIFYFFYAMIKFKNIGVQFKCGGEGSTNENHENKLFDVFWTVGR